MLCGTKFVWIQIVNLKWMIFQVQKNKDSLLVQILVQ